MSSAETSEAGDKGTQRSPEELAAVAGQAWRTRVSPKCRNKGSLAQNFRPPPVPTCGKCADAATCWPPGTLRQAEAASLPRVSNGKARSLPWPFPLCGPGGHFL